MTANHEHSKNLLVPTDFSESCDNALNHAIEIAKFLGSSVYVLHVITSESVPYLAKDQMQIEKVIGHESSEESVVNEKLTQYVKSKNFENLVPVSRQGDIFHTISTVASEIKARLIILGTHGKIGFQRITGSYALKVIDSTEVPVIVVQKRGFIHGYKDIVFPISLIDKDRQKAKNAVQIAKIFDSTVHIFPRMETNEVDRAKLNARIAQVMEYFNEYEVKYKEVYSNEYGNEYDKQILNYSASVNADLILIMSDADKHSALFGAKEENIIFNSTQIPVMCINTERISGSTFWSWGSFQTI